MEKHIKVIGSDGQEVAHRVSKGGGVILDDPAYPNEAVMIIGSTQNYGEYDTGPALNNRAARRARASVKRRYG